jgi:hypothetical protein
MGKATKKKQELLQARQPDFSGILAKASEIQAKKAYELESFDPLNVIKGYEGYAIRPLDRFIPRTRSLNKTTRCRELIRYAFNKYNPPEFLYSVWDPTSWDQSNISYGHLFSGMIKEDFKLWYLALAQGRSLYKERTMGLLSRQETHYFATCPFALTMPQAVWYAVIRGMDEKAPPARARKFASTKLASHPIDEFWRGVVRWFARNEVSVRQMNDLLDYVAARHRENPEWYLRDQTLVNLQKSMHAWHRELYRAKAMSTQYKSWEGIKVADSEIERVKNKTKTIWNFHQIKTGKELAEEGNRQHHCVSSYGSQCHSGAVSIWSLTQRDQFNSPSRALTIEVTREGTIVQARGYANRMPRADESSVLKEWAAKSGFRVRGLL